MVRGFLDINAGRSKASNNVNAYNRMGPSGLLLVKLHGREKPVEFQGAGIVHAVGSSSINVAVPSMCRHAGNGVFLRNALQLGRQNAFPYQNAQLSGRLFEALRRMDTIKRPNHRAWLDEENARPEPEVQTEEGSERMKTDIDGKQRILASSSWTKKATERTSTNTPANGQAERRRLGTGWMLASDVSAITGNIVIFVLHINANGHDVEIPTIWFLGGIEGELSVSNSLGVLLNMGRVKLDNQSSYIDDYTGDAHEYLAFSCATYLVSCSDPSECDIRKRSPSCDIGRVAGWLEGIPDVPEDILVRWCSKRTEDCGVIVDRRACLLDQVFEHRLEFRVP
ncbi:hypothetical protein BD779DRAFT_1482004 [Infundibulicybe gibba]|nr:hypothetical protein BD779DRAFT_1482004 [Infundibulicybe gibba]